MHPFELCNFIPIQWMSIGMHLSSRIVVEWRHIRIASLDIQGATTSTSEKVLRAFVLSRGATRGHISLVFCCELLG